MFGATVVSSWTERPREVRRSEMVRLCRWDLVADQRRFRQGQVSWNQLRGPRHLRLLPDIYIRATADLLSRDPVADRIPARRAPGSSLGGYSAATLLGGLRPAPGLTEVVVDRYGFVIAGFDLAYPEGKLAIEYDGLGHGRRMFSKDDRSRDITTGDHGWHTMRFGYDGVHVTTRATVELVRSRLARRRRRASRST